VGLAGANLQVNAAQNLLLALVGLDRYVQVLDF
jgi:hypothetical protein